MRLGRSFLDSAQPHIFCIFFRKKHPNTYGRKVHYIRKKNDFLSEVNLVAFGRNFESFWLDLNILKTYKSAGFISIFAQNLGE